MFVCMSVSKRFNLVVKIYFKCFRIFFFFCEKKSLKTVIAYVIVVYVVEAAFAVIVRLLRKIV